MKNLTSIVLLAGMFFLLAGCQVQHDPKEPLAVQETSDSEEAALTVLTIKNESSHHFQNIRCDGKDFNPYRLTEPSRSESKSYNRKVEGYIYFDVVWKHDSFESKFHVSTVRTSDLIIVEKDAQKTVIITDNTLVTLNGTQQSVPLISLKPAYINIKDKAASVNIDMDSILYAGNSCELINDEYLIRCEEDKEDYISFTVKYKNLYGNVSSDSVTMVQKINVQKGETKRIVITDETEVTASDGRRCKLKALFH